MIGMNKVEGLDLLPHTSGSSSGFLLLKQKFLLDEALVSFC